MNSLRDRLVRVVISSLEKYGRYETGMTPDVMHKWNEESFLISFRDGPSYIVTVHECSDTK